jgi:hypothetical protein
MTETEFDPENVLRWKIGGRREKLVDEAAYDRLLALYRARGEELKRANSMEESLLATGEKLSEGK